jgi:hypothetical protein
MSNNKWNDDSMKEFVETNSNCKFISLKKDDKNIWLTLECSCGEKFTTTKGSFVRGKRQCSNCGKDIYKQKITKWDSKIAEDYVNKRNNDGFTYVDYQRESKNIKFKLICKCGNEFDVSKNSFNSMKIVQCPTCAYKMLGENKSVWNDENLKDYVENNSECNYILFERNKKEKGTTIRLKLKCKCGETFFTDKGDFDKGKKQCNKCGKKAHKEKVGIYNDDNLKRVVEENSNSKYLSHYRRNDSTLMLKLKCECGREYETTKSHFDKGKKVCNVCNGFSEDFGKVSLGEKCTESIELWDYEKNIDTPYDVSYASDKQRWFKCHNNIHNSEYKIVGDFYNGGRCSICSSQLKESRLATTLKQVLKHEFPNTQWEYNVGFKGKKGGNSKYDIYVPELNLLIEVQSGYHDDEEQAKLDAKKEKYAIKNGYEFITIDCREVTPLNGIKLFFSHIESMPSYVIDIKNTLINWDVEFAQSLLDEDNDLTYDDISKILNIPKSTLASAVVDGRLNSANHKKSHKEIRKSVVQLGLNGEYIQTFKSVNEAMKQTGATKICQCSKGELKSSGGYKWMYLNDYEELNKK